MCRLVDCFENSLVEGRIYRYTLSPKAAAIFPGTPCLDGGGGGTYHTRPHAQRTTPSGGDTLPSGGGYWVCIAIHRVCSDIHR